MQHEAVKLLYQKEWVYNFEELLWFHKLNLNDPMNNPQFFNIKKWELQEYLFTVKKEQFAKIEDFEIYSEINEGESNNSSV